jgi:16S rRNA (guanine966-N2)-methyltransferase
MRVVSGLAKGKTLKAVPGDSTRPILDRVKTALFDILRPDIQGVSVLDLFAGTGAVGIEALSQGAAHCVFLDTNKRAVATIKENLASCDLTARGEVRHTDAFIYLKNTARSFDLIYIAPPQYRGIWIEALRVVAERPHLLKPVKMPSEGEISGGEICGGKISGGKICDKKIIVQIDPKEYEPLILNTLVLQSERRYGNTLLLFYGLAE